MGSTPLTRRAWLASLTAAWLGRPARAETPPLSADEQAELAAVRDSAGKFGLRTLTTAEPTTHYLGIGDAPREFQARALKLCEGLTADYLRHFRDKGFAVKAPERRLTVVIMANARSFSAILGAEQAVAVGGVYDLQTNRLFMFDNQGRGNAKAAVANTVALFHEAMHQLTFNTGLLDRRADVPLCISEGLAMYAETRNATGTTPIGRDNRPRLEVLKTRNVPGAGWIALEKLLADDKHLEPESDSGDAAVAMAQQWAYSQSWLLIHYFLKTPSRLPRLMAYLDAVRTRMDSAHRLEDARIHLGDLKELDRDLLKYARQKT